MPAAQFAVFGHPIAHSLSPQIHQAFARQFMLDISYRRIDAASAEFAGAVRHFFAEGGSGANVTLPHKVAAFAMADQRSDAAMHSGSANVLTRLADGRLAAHNTDGHGMVRDLTQRHGVALRGRNTLVIGAGGAARGVAWVLRDAGVETLVVVNRSAPAAQTLAAVLGEPARAQAWADLPAMGRLDLIVNATSAGVLGGALGLPTSLVGPDTVCYDLSYGDAARDFLAWAGAAGARRVCDGLGMLVETAADAFALWHGQRPQTESVYQSLRTAAV